jgi:energy-coupling factor transport system permease protein
VPYHTLTWLTWLAAAAYLALANSQPLPSLLVILASAMCFDLSTRRNLQGQGWGVFLRLGLWVGLVALAFNLLSVHAGEIVLLTLPRQWPVIGGNLTLEALLYGLGSGASLFAVLLVFATFNIAVETQRLLRWMPPGLYQAGLVVSISVAFVPQMMRSLQDIREAQRVRGHAFRGLRDLVPLFVPLVTTALERSLTLAESMEARGFGGVVAQSPSSTLSNPRLLTLAGLSALLAAMLWQTTGAQPAWAGLAWLVLGLVLCLLAIYVQGRRIRRTHYQREVWQRRDAGVILASLASLVLVFVAQWHDPQAVAYYPYPPLSPWPTFAPLAGLSAALIAMPALLWPVNSSATRHEACP